MEARLSERLAVSMPFTEADIGGTNTAGSSDAVHWVDMRGWDRILIYLEIGTWNATDDLDSCKVEQATSSAGAGKKDLTTSGAGATYDYNESAPLDADGDFVIFDIRAEDLDVKNGFTHVRIYASEGGNTGVDNVHCVYIRSNGQVNREQLSGAAVAGEKKYIRPGIGAQSLGV